MIAAREEAKRKREEEMKENEETNENLNHNNNDDDLDLLQGFADDIHEEIQKQKHPSLNWTPNTNTINAASKYKNTYIKRRKRYELLSSHNTKKRIPSLLQIALNSLCDNFMYVDSLGYGVDSTIRKLICQTLLAKGKLNGAAFDILTEDGIDSLEIGDCAIITQDQLCEAFDRLVPQGLKAVLLEYAGRCFGVKAVDTLIKHKEVSSIFALSISGAYLLKDDIVANLINALSKSLSSIELKACPLLGTRFCESIASSYGLSSSASLLELLLEDLTLTKEQLLLLNKSNNSAGDGGSMALSNLRQLKLSRVGGVDDELIQSILSSMSNNSLQSLILNDLDNVTDISLIQIRNCNANDTLRVLHLSSLKDITEIGLELLFTNDLDERREDVGFDMSSISPSPPKLTRLDLSNNSNNVVTDNIMSLVLQTYGTTDTTTTTTNSSYYNNYKTSNTIGLTYLNMSNTTSITDTTMENLSHTCPTTLQEINLSFCPKVTDKGLGYLVSKIGNQLNKLSIWGCAQLTDAFLDGHDRVLKRGDDDDGLDIVGSWMKRRKL